MYHSKKPVRQVSISTIDSELVDNGACPTARTDSGRVIGALERIKVKWRSSVRYLVGSDNGGGDDLLAHE
jgi:hypothetical protein